MYIADLHIHSHYSRATSKDCNLENLDLWARRKGIHIVGTGDFTHPAWRAEMEKKLDRAEDGLYTLKKEYRIQDSSVPHTAVPRFVITGEISSIYKKNDKVRKVHSLILLPGLEAAEIFSVKLEAVGNIHSDGRPILGLDCHDLLDIMLEMCPGAMYIPAHIWTPHFSLFGAFSGFDSVEECYEDLSGHIHAMETGLSSDPPMNWRISSLDKYQLISNSDAHSPSKLGREANLLDIELSYGALKEAIETGKGLYGTIEFFPEEGKYHFDGHRKCGICLSPVEAQKYKGICPVCGRRLTTGVSHRIEQLCDRPEGFVREQSKVFESLVPLPEVIGASLGYSAASVKVQKEYENMLRSLGTEFEILRTIPTSDIESVSGHMIGEGISRLRQGKVERLPGFDGEYGTIKLFTREEMNNLEGQMSFFSDLHINPSKAVLRPSVNGGQENRKEKIPEPQAPCQAVGEGRNKKDSAFSLNPKQERAARMVGAAIAVIAGPGTGKTKTLISRLLYLLEARKVKPCEITAVTFTNKAAGEMKERVKNEMGRARNLNNLQIGTFHALCLDFLKKQGREFVLADEGAALEAAKQALELTPLQMKPKELLNIISRRKSGLDGEQKSHPISAGETKTSNITLAVQTYGSILKEQNMLDFDDLLLEALELAENKVSDPEWTKGFSYLLVDEFQDISPLQYRLIKMWCKKGRELFVIGDPDQSIYSFRGSDAQCFDRLKSDFPSLLEIRLAENYRCPPSILTAATHLIDHNPGPKRNLITCSSNERPVRIVSAAGPMGEAVFIAKEINRLAGGISMLDAQEIYGNDSIRGFGDIAVLYRTHQQAEVLEKCLRTEGIPYVTAGRESFLAEDKVRGSLAFFKYLANSNDNFSKILCLKLLADKKLPMAPDLLFDVWTEKFEPLFSKSKPQKFMQSWMKELQEEDCAGMEKLAQMSIFYKSMGQFLEALSLGVESDLKRCKDKHYTGEAVNLMTLHGAKGLEFPVTFVCGVRKGLIPLERAEAADREEERRLFYVGMTRAKEELILTTSGQESGFLRELPESSVVQIKTDNQKNGVSGTQMSIFDL